MATEDLKILIVDDQQDNLQLMLNCLFEGAYYNILCCTSGEDAIEIALKEQPDLILMDSDMPGINGVEAIVRLKKEKSTRNTPMIITNGATMNSADLKFAFEAGASDFICKPIDKIELLARVNSHLSISKHIKQLTEQKNTIQNEREKHTAHVRSTISKLCRNTAELIKYTCKEHKNIAHELNNLQKKNQNEKVILDQISKILAQICEVCNKYNSFYNLHFQDDEYVKRLLKKHPNLLPSEIKLCFFLKKNLYSKEIANLINRSVNTVKVARSRLRKKLNIETNENLVNYLVKI